MPANAAFLKAAASMIKKSLPKAAIKAASFEDVSPEELEKVISDIAERKRNKSELARRLLALPSGRAFRVNAEKRLVQARVFGFQKKNQGFRYRVLDGGNGWTYVTRVSQNE
jgi:hypothetical protein